MQVDYTLSGYTFEGVSIPSAVLHIKQVTFEATGTAIVDVEIYTDATIMSTSSPLRTAQWAYPITDGQTTAEVWTSLCAQSGLTDQQGNAISLTGATPVTGE
jgi:hypothetical protein